jgi:hypothetical protein
MTHAMQRFCTELACCFTLASMLQSWVQWFAVESI